MHNRLFEYYNLFCCKCKCPAKYHQKCVLPKPDILCTLFHKTFLEEKAAKFSYTSDYEYTRENIAGYWTNLLLFVLAFALLATITLEFIDKDKR